MSKPDLLWEKLAAAGLVQGEMPPVEKSPPWYVRTLQGFSGWLAAFFMLGFMGTLFHGLFDQPWFSLGVGTLLVALAVVLLRHPGKVFADQFGLAASLAGQVLWLVGQKDYWQDSSFWLLWAAVQVGLIWLVALPVHRFLSATAVVYALSAASINVTIFWLMPSLLMLVMAVLWLTETRWLPKAGLWSPVAAAVSLCVLQMHATSVISPTVWSEIARQGRQLQAPPVWILTLNEWLIAGVWLCSAAILLQRSGIRWASRHGKLAWGGMVAIALISQQAQGLTIAWLMLLLGFAQGHRLLLGLGMVAFWGYLGRYYYLLDATLLSKSGVLAVSAAVFLAGYALLHLNSREAQDHA